MYFSTLLVGVRGSSATMRTCTGRMNFGIVFADFGQVSFELTTHGGDEANAFLSKWQQGTAWLLQDAGLAKTSPEEFGIARPGE